MDFIFELIAELVCGGIENTVNDKKAGNKVKFISIMILVIPILAICGLIAYSAVKAFAADKLTTIILFAIDAFILGMCIYAIVYNVKKK